jgi:hypothetical protein
MAFLVPLLGNTNPSDDAKKRQHLPFSLWAYKPRISSFVSVLLYITFFYLMEKQKNIGRGLPY